ncbi:hypothetical protein C8Q79DRAFT_1019314 [Trametes meyenii]|nr:hypothetical protein C8Q79DRAFT_1019314 [Trametes meyenii]
MPPPRPRPWSAVLWPSVLFVLLACLVPALAQGNGSSPTPTQTNTPSVSLSLTTGLTTFTTTVHSGNQNVPVTSTVPITFNVTVTPSQSTSTSSASASATTSAVPDFTKLDTHLDPGFGVLGALLILTGLPSAFLGHKNRWSSFFIIGFYTLALTCFVLILRFGVLNAINPPNKTLRGLFVLSCGVAGVAGGGIAIFFWKAAKYFIGAWGGFAFALWIQCFHNGGLIGPIGFRWIMYIGFVLCTIPKLHYYVLLTSTAAVGATAFMLGVDCFTTAGLKEFYVWNIGFQSLFTKYQEHGIKFPVTQIMEIELGMMGAVTIMGMAVQFQILKILQRKLKEIEAERKRQDQEAEARAAVRFRELEAEKDEWARDHPSLLKHGRADSGLSGTPLLNKDGFPTTDPDSPLGTPRQRHHSGLSEFMAAPTPSDELQRAANKQLQTPGALPALDLGDDIEANVPKTFITDKADALDRPSKPLTPAELEDLKRRSALLSEIQTIRKSIELLRADTPGPTASTSSDSRHPSLTSRQLSQELGALPVVDVPPAHLRPPRQKDPRARVQSMELSNLSRASDVGGSIGRPTSAPLRDDDWDLYLHERKLLQPPAGVTPPIATTPVSPMPRIPVSPAVVEALKERQQRENALSHPRGATPELTTSKDSSSSEDLPLALRPQHHKKTSSQGHVPVTILPPKRSIAQPAPKAAETSPRVKTFEELVERHREKLHELQAPLTQAEKEAAEVNDARSRWERAKAAEKQAMAKRQAEKEQAVRDKTRKSGEGRRGGVASPDGGEKRHTRSLSADVLANVPGMSTSSRRMSTMKVEDWQRHQVDVDPQGARTTSPRHHHHPSASMSRRQSGVPFPEGTQTHRRMSSMPRDPVS